MHIKSIVFAQDSDAHEPLKMLDDLGPDATIDHLLQWEDDGNPIATKSLRGTADRFYQRDDLTLVWNAAIGYVGLERIIP